MRDYLATALLMGPLLLLGAGCGDDDGDDGDGTAMVDAGPGPGAADAAADAAGAEMFDVGLAGENEVPPVETAASGEVTVTRSGNMLDLTGAFSDLESDLMEVSGSAAHIHRGDADETGPIVFNLEVTSADDRSGTLAGSFQMNAEQIELYEQGLLYVNVHTVDNPAGEIRGQLVPES